MAPPQSPVAAQEGSTTIVTACAIVAAVVMQATAIASLAAVAAMLFHVSTEKS